ncbi:signal peptidase I [Alkalitalea saponilacus]|uniref:Signal peptidase I n=1 Tax=Alkalitalea saponilacus TaxID=889453 RepID=A0A1T5GFV6_9BACT|nr:signal peptidase I [Alkalitalea saponilacus]ASB47960.1 signal peptidase I [Alkalitalea saponilacus]SKC07250.1 signal peptidase I [Alkalitalea saponilacus]
MIKYINYIFPFLILLHLILGIWWMAMGWGIVWLLFWMGTSKLPVIVKFRKITWLIYPLVIIGAVLAAITFKTLFFGIYAIPSGSMEKTIIPGDVVYVNNLAYGPRLPYSPYEVSWINLLVWLWEGKSADLEKRWWEYNRLKGYSSPKRGDIAVFNHPHNGNIFIKRIVALPGDTLQIVHGDLYINGKKQETPKNRLIYSKAQFKDLQDAYFILDSLNIRMYHNNSVSEKYLFNGNITKSDTDILKQHPRVINTGIDPVRPDTAWSVFPHSHHLSWSIDNYGPYVLPKKGLVMKRSPDNLTIYEDLMNYDAQFRRGHVNDSCGHFTFCQDYYFFMGDNFHDSEDSRYFGPVREEYLIGKASFIIYSSSKNNKAMSRILKRLR